MTAALPHTAHHGMRTPDLLAAALINIVWGLNIIAAKMAISATAPYTAAFLRQALVMMICLPFLKIVPGRMRVLLTLGAIAGGFQMMVNLSLVMSENLAALAIAGQLGVPFSLILAVLFLGERIAVRRLIGIVLAFGGVVILVFDPGVGRELPGVLMTVFGALLWAMSSLIQRKLAGVPVLTIYGWTGLVGSIIFAPLMLLIEPRTVAALPGLPLRDLGWILFSALGSTVIGQGGMAWLLQRHPVSTVMPLTLAAPVIAVIASSLFFGTVLTPVMILGAMIAMGGVAIIVLRSAQKLEPRSRGERAK